MSDVMTFDEKRMPDTVDDGAKISIAGTLEHLTIAVEIFDSVSPALTSDEYRAFLFIAKNEGTSIVDLQQALGLTQPTASRVVGRLFEGLKGRESGRGLIRAIADPGCRRRLLLYPTPKGLGILNRIANALNG